MNIVNILQAEVNDVNMDGRLTLMAGNGYHHGGLHQAILDAAVAEAGRCGPQGVQVRALAKLVGVSPSAVYRHMASLDALLAEVAQVARERLARHMIGERDRAMTGAGECGPHRRGDAERARERFRSIGLAYVGFALAEPHLFDTAFTPTQSHPTRMDDPSAWAVLTEAVQELIDSRAITTSDADRAALIAWSGVHGIASILVRQALVSPVADDAAIDVVLDAVQRAVETL